MTEEMLMNMVKYRKWLVIYGTLDEFAPSCTHWAFGAFRESGLVFSFATQMNWDVYQIY